MDSYVYFRRLEDGSLIYLLLYVDDMLILAKHMSDIDVLKQQLSVEFEMKDLGAIKKILGMEILHDRDGGTLRLSREKCQKSLKPFALVPISPTHFFGANSVLNLLYWC